MSVTRIREAPRVTKPFSDERWARSTRSASRSTPISSPDDVRLTMGGEPTFVSIDDRKAPSGTPPPSARPSARCADELIRRLRERFAPGGLLHYGQGKWYPGESLPRWAFALYWRKDGEPIWREPDADRQRSQTAQGATTADAERLRWSGIGEAARHRRATYVHAGLRGPGALDLRGGASCRSMSIPPTPSSTIPRSARAWRGSSSAGSTTPVGYVLPSSAGTRGDAPALASEHWKLAARASVSRARRLADRLSPAARLAAAGRRRRTIRSTSSSRDPMAPRAELRAQIRQASAQPQPRRIEKVGRPPVRTALSIEPRDGVLYVFMPPVERVEDYLELIAAVEATADELRLPVHVEGYAPPYDPRLDVIKVTPDPGVIEVNMQPARKLARARRHHHRRSTRTRAQTRLGAEKFMLDGRHTGTGGGNHIVVGGPTPADSPFLRRPDLLESLVLYWQHHPSLSYLFSGLFIGPTSQAPRIDEARHDALYELEIALAQMPRARRRRPPPWLVDRLFRNLLVDVTGNTHRAEICIDKLYLARRPDRPPRPASSSARFEMPPHARMSLAQQLLVRALVAWFWREP